MFGNKATAVASPADLKGKTIAVTKGSIEDQELSKVAPPEATIQRHDDNAAALAAYVGGKAQLLAGGISVITGLKPRQGLAALVAFLVPTTLQMHRFWEIDDPHQRMLEMTQFSKNLALIGAALALMQLDEPWPASIERAPREEEMFVRIGGQDLRALPA